MPCDHALTAEHPADAGVADIRETGGEVQLTVVLPCPECDGALAVEAAADSAAETDLPLPLDDAEDVYD